MTARRTRRRGGLRRWSAVVCGLTATTLAAAGMIGIAPAAALAACTVTWAGPAEGGWSTAANWSPARRPRTTDVVCTPPGTSPTITIGTAPGAGVTVRELRTGTATIVVGSSLRATELDPSGGTLTGGGGVFITDRMTMQQSTTTTLSVHQAEANVVVVAGTVVLNDGALLVADDRMTLGDGAHVVDGDADAANRVGLFGSLRVAGTARVEVPVIQFAAGEGVVVPAGSILQLDRPDGFTPDGRLPIGTYTIAGTLVLPRTLTALGHVAFHVTGTGDVVTTSSTSALSELATVDGSGATGTVFDQDFVDDVALTVTGFAKVTLNGHVTVPSIQAVHGFVTVNGTVTTTAAAGVQASQSSIITVGRDAAIVGAVFLGRGGRLSLDPGADAPPTLTGDLTTSTRATTLASWPPATTPPQTAELRVSGVAHLTGTLSLTRSGPALPVGARLRILTADGGITGRYDTVVVTDPNHQTARLVYTGTQLLAQITGPATP